MLSASLLPESLANTYWNIENLHKNNIRICFVYLLFVRQLHLTSDSYSMKHLYIIGNGFDIFTGLKTRYVDFRRWLENNYPFVYEDMQAAYDMDVEWWNEFEVQLGKLDVKAYVRKFTPPMKSKEEILKAIEERKAFDRKYNLPPSLHYDSPCARRLRGLLDILQYCFEKWVEDCQRMFIGPKYVHLEKEDSFFINFNYTDVLQWLYEIPEERVLHIHGRAAKREHLIFGHNSFLRGDGSDDEEKTCLELSRYEKNPYVYIFRHGELPDILKDIEQVHVYGFSFSPVDEDYMDWIYRHVPSDAQWEVSWYSEIDKQRIDGFVLDHWGLKKRLKMIRLEELN